MIDVISKADIKKADSTTSIPFHSPYIKNQIGRPKSENNNLLTKSRYPIYYQFSFYALINVYKEGIFDYFSSKKMGLQLC